MLASIVTKLVWADVYVAVRFPLDLSYNAEGAMAYSNMLVNN